ncbi:hypothetical protein CR513_11028, partial [Mucuna pruriens]
MVDALAILSSMFEISPEKETLILQIRHQIVPPYCQEVKEENPTDILENNIRMLRRLAMSVLLDREVLYKRNFDMTLLCCVNAQEAKE